MKVYTSNRNTIVIKIDSERRQENEENSYCSRYAKGLY
ncbi:hypothetical protein HNQ46_001712 [Oribacterium sinus]|uniref:Uncharacterized protein n=1 Tax=Oribacterium sinus TaxID=237576 RepID=A0A7W9SGI0_9FIRM|nr:hypothetical protein [Oribacterium sinus]